MDETKQIVDEIGSILKKIRKEHQYSIEEAAKKMGISKLTLGKIERGETNPTVGVLAKIATGLEIPLMALFLGNNRIQIARAGQSIKIADQHEGWAIEPIFEQVHSATQMYRLYIEANCAYEAAKHQTNTTEVITVMRGTLHITVDGEQYVLEEFDSFSFRSDQPHIYENLSKERLVLHAVLRYGI